MSTNCERNDNRQFYPSIFNDVLGPVTQGPSSSNTVGPYRIGRLARDMVRGKIKSVEFEMSEKGGFKDTFFSMDSDKGLLSGILGRDIINDDLNDVYRIAEEEGLKYSFTFSDRIQSIPSEVGELRIVSEVGSETGSGAENSALPENSAEPGKVEELTLTGISLGGGEILITEVNGEKTNITGREEMQFTPAGFSAGMASAPLQSDASTGGAEKSGERVLHSVYPFNMKKDAKPPFTNSEELALYAKLPENEGRPLYEIAIDYETSVTECSREDVLLRAEKMLDLQYKAIEKGYEEGIKFDGITTAKAAGIKKLMNGVKSREAQSAMSQDAQNAASREPQSREAQNVDARRLIPSGITDEAGLDALSLMEYSNSHGIICCMPTGGATGIIPSAIKGASKALGLTKQEEIQALIVSGLIGVFYYESHYSGSLGCQAEVGIATSMAAGALCSMLTNDIDKIEAASVLAMECLLGQVCDPIGGYVQIPCFIRNVASVSIATTCANYGVLGLESGVNLDEISKAVIRVGEGLRRTRLNDQGTCACNMLKNII